LRIIEPFPQTGKERTRDIDGSMGHGVGVFEDQSFQVREIEIGSIAMKIRNLVGRDAVRSAHGRADVDSKRTADQCRDAQLGEPFQFGIDRFARELGVLHLSVSP